MRAFDFVQWLKNTILMGHGKYGCNWYLLEMFKNLNCSITLLNSDNLIIFKYRNSKIDFRQLYYFDISTLQNYMKFVVWKNHSACQILYRIPGTVKNGIGGKVCIKIIDFGPGKNLGAYLFLTQRSTFYGILYFKTEKMLKIKKKH